MPDKRHDPLSPAPVEELDTLEARSHARIAAAYFTELLTQGVPEDVAEQLTQDWLSYRYWQEEP